MNFVYLVFLGLAWAVIEALIGGTRLPFSLPAYGLLSVGALLTLASIRGKRIPPDPFCLFSTLLLGGWILTRASHSPVEYLAWPDFFMMIGCLMAYLITAFYLAGTLEQTVLIGVLWSIAAAEVWVAMIQFIKEPKFMLFGLMRPSVGRPSGLYVGPNSFAGFLVTVALISISMAVWSRWRAWAKILAFYFAMICLFGVAISGSRGSYFAAIGGLLCFAICSVYMIRAAQPEKFMPVAIASLVGLIAVVGLAGYLMANSQYLSHRMQMMATKDVRIYNWEAAVDHSRVSPWVGTGAGTHQIYARLFRRPQIQADPTHAHCDYLELLAEYGVAGAVCMALFLTAHVRNAIRSLADILHRRLIPSGLNRSNTFAIQLGALCAVAGLAIHSVFDFDMHIPGNALIFAFLFGVLANPGTERNLGFVDRRLTPWAKLVAPGLAVFMLWRGFQVLPTEYCAELARTSLRDGHYLDAIHYAQMGLGASAASQLGIPVPASAADQQPDMLHRVLKISGPNPNNPNLYLYIGESNRALAAGMMNPYLNRRFYGAATKAYEAGLKVFPQDEDIMVRYGQVLDAMQHYPEAEGVYQKALAGGPKFSELHYIYATHLAAEGKSTEAEAETALAKELNTAPGALEPEVGQNYQLQ